MLRACTSSGAWRRGCPGISRGLDVKTLDNAAVTRTEFMGTVDHRRLPEAPGHVTGDAEAQADQPRVEQDAAQY